jgi:hypothetical protein
LENPPISLDPSKITSCSFAANLPMVVANGSEERNVQFPLLDTPDAFHGIGKHRGTAHMMPGLSGGLSGPVWTLIESLQPYHSAKWPETELLGQIQAIDNWDKHRRVVASVATASGIDLNIVNKSGASIEHQVFNGILEPGAILASGTIQYAPGIHVEMAPEMNLLPIFDKGMAKEIAGRPAIEILYGACGFIREVVLPMFERLI